MYASAVRQNVKVLLPLVDHQMVSIHLSARCNLDILMQWFIMALKRYRMGSNPRRLSIIFHFCFRIEGTCEYGSTYP